jgi:hypothetical protein
MSIKILSNGTAIAGASVIYDNNTIGTTNENGELNYTFNSSGSHTIFATKNYYVPVSLDIDVREPYSEFKAIDLDIMPTQIFENEKIMVKSNITNAGTKADIKSIELFVNDSIVDNKTIQLLAKETKEINFTYKSTLKEGNYTIRVLEQKQIIEVKKAPINIILVLAMLIVIGVVVIYIVTEKDRFTGLINRKIKI